MNTRLRRGVVIWYYSLPSANINSIKVLRYQINTCVEWTITTLGFRLGIDLAKLPFEVGIQTIINGIWLGVIIG